MKIIKYQKLKSNKYKVILSNNDELILYDEVILKNNLLLTKEINDIDNILNENIFYDAYFNSLKYIQRKLRTKKELNNYLSLKYESNIINDVLNKIEEDGYLNDELYIKSYIHDQILLTNNGYYKIKRYLLDNNLDEDLIYKYLDEIDNEVWLERIKKIVNKKIKSNNKYSTSKLKEKIISYLVDLGYNKSDILNIINKITIDEDSDILEKNYNLLYKKLSKKYNGKDLELQLLNKMISKGYKYNEIKKIMSKS